MLPVRHQSNVTKAAKTATDAHAQEFSVSYSYPVHFTRDSLNPDNTILVDSVSRLEPRNKHRILPVIDRNVLEGRPDLGRRLEAYVTSHADVLELAGPPEVLDGGEAAKNDPAHLERLVRAVHDLGLDRHCQFLVVGGGAIQDMAGYAAAVCHRGIRVVRMPTTVASQNDSGVGVKCGVNKFGVKNFLGAFAPPFAVVNDFDFIETLPTRERIAGMSEAVKVALIRDRNFFDWLETRGSALAEFQEEAMSTMIRRSAELHLEHIATSGDPFESGNSRPLDFGHWAAHKLESLSGFEIRHGEAVAVGLALDVRYSCLSRELSDRSATRIVDLLEKLGFRLWHESLAALDDNGSPAVLAGLEEFREHLGGELTISLLDEIGREAEVHEVDSELMREALSWLQARDAGR